MSDLRRGMKLIKKRHSKLKSLSKSGKKRPKSRSKQQESEEEFEYDSNDYDDDDDEDQMPQAELIIKVEDTILGGN